MIVLVTGLLLIPVLDQALKFFVLFRLGPRSVPLGRMGKLQVVQTQIWMARTATLSEPTGALDGVDPRCVRADRGQLSRPIVWLVRRSARGWLA